MVLAKQQVPYQLPHDTEIETVICLPPEPLPCMPHLHEYAGLSQPMLGIVLVGIRMCMLWLLATVAAVNGRSVLVLAIFVMFMCLVGLHARYR